MLQPPAHRAGPRRRRWTSTLDALAPRSSGTATRCTGCSTTCSSGCCASGCSPPSRRPSPRPRRASTSRRPGSRPARSRGWLDEHARDGRRVGRGVPRHLGPRRRRAHRRRARRAPTAAPPSSTPSALDADDEQALAGWLADPAVPKAVHDVKGPLLALRQHGWTLAGVTSDTQLGGLPAAARPARLRPRRPRAALPAPRAAQQRRGVRPAHPRRRRSTSRTTLWPRSRPSAPRPSRTSPPPSTPSSTRAAPLGCWPTWSCR